MNYLRKIYLFALPALLSVSAVAQQAPDSARSLLEKMQAAYGTASYLSFQVSYFYANEGQAGHPMDSLSGMFQMDKSRVLFSIAGTETLVTPVHTIRVQPEERIMILGRSAQGAQANPAAMVDTLLRQLKGTNVQVKEEGKNAILSIGFPAGMQYKRVEMVVDSQTDYLEEITYYLKTEGLVEQEMIKSAGHDAPYESEGRVRIVFSRYRQQAFGESVFDETHFISRVGQVYQPAAAYKGYQLILASSNL